ncbi:MAG: hypothetical protein QOF51_3859, partial [Chloroflexota bacterium]|nr:hypothetical protein [Chloroflexota bacterium]
MSLTGISRAYNTSRAILSTISRNADLRDSMCTPTAGARRLGLQSTLVLSVLGSAAFSFLALWPLRALREIRPAGDGH